MDSVEDQRKADIQRQIDLGVFGPHGGVRLTYFNRDADTGNPLPKKIQNKRLRLWRELNPQPPETTPLPRKPVLIHSVYHVRLFKELGL